MVRPFKDRRDAGRQLATRLAAYDGRPDVLVLALPRGGVPVAYEVARALSAPLRLFVVRKLGVPGQEELAMGAVASGDVRLVNEELIRSLRIPAHRVLAVLDREQRELRRRQDAYDGRYAFPELRDLTVVLVDDGIATGASMYAAVRAIQAQEPRSTVIAVPVVAAQTLESMRTLVDDFAFVLAPTELHGVGLWYDDFAQTTDDEVRALLAAAYDAEDAARGDTGG